MDLVVRQAIEPDASSIADIYNQAILTTVATFDTEPKSVDNRLAWMEEHRAQGYPVLVAELEGKVVGWASLTAWSDRCAYSKTAETSVYVLADHHGKRIGTNLLESLVREAMSSGLHTLLARIADNNEASIRVHQRFGFECVGVMREVGQKFGRLIDVHLMQLILPEGGS